ncbi:MAG TPA: lamin tail domain-containing protein [Ignavibacteria bacterium]|nr:lamin tail domain-containing protein [Ignavibacteria bacterium]
MKKMIFAIFTLLTINSSPSQIVINELMYAPSDATNEWFEIFNTGSAPADLKNWKWKDATSAVRTITTRNIILPGNSFAVICQDSLKLNNQFPEITSIIIQTVWSTLNNTGDNVILIMPDNTISDSVSFLSAWGGSTGGSSLERINSSSISNSPDNWGTSIDIRKGTPAKVNSITPKPFDLYMKKFEITPLFPVSGESLTFDFIIKNSGLNVAGNFILNIYNDSDLDSTAENNELINSKSFTSLSYKDSVTYNYTLRNIDSGYKQFIAKVDFVQDDDTLNNSIIKRIYVSSQTGGGGGLIINEIMFDPLSNNSEWIELFNATGQTLNLKGWKYKEASSSVILSSVDLYLNPGDYFVLAHDSTVYDIFDYLKAPQPNRTVKISTGISLNNTGENLTITDSLNNIIDAVYYDPDWKNPEITDTKGISLERINPSLNSNERSNWSSSADPKGGTPGLRNSIFTVNKISGSNVAISPNPFSPDGDGFEDFTIIKYKMNVPFMQMRVKIFDIKGRFVKELVNNQISGSEGSIIFNGYGSDDLKLRIGIYILLIEAIDQRGGTIKILKKPLVIAGKM